MNANPYLATACYEHLSILFYLVSTLLFFLEYFKAVPRYWPILPVNTSVMHIFVKNGER